MERWIGRVAVVANAGNDVGNAICEELLRYRMRVLSFVTRCPASNTIPQRIKQGEHPGELYSMACNILYERNIDRLFNLVDKRFKSAGTCIFIHDLPLNSQLFPQSNDFIEALIECEHVICENEIALLEDGGKFLRIRSTPPNVRYTSIYTEMEYLVVKKHFSASIPQNVEKWTLFITPVDPERPDESLSIADIVNAVIEILMRPPERV